MLDRLVLTGQDKTNSPVHRPNLFDTLVILKIFQEFVVGGRQVLYKDKTFETSSLLGVGWGGNIVFLVLENCQSVMGVEKLDDDGWSRRGQVGGGRLSNRVAVQDESGELRDGRDASFGFRSR